MVLKGKVILLISPQAWGTMWLSKHHYALELAKKGNRVFFLNPPDQKLELKKGTVSIVQSDLHSNLLLIFHRTNFPYWIKFRWFFLFKILMRFHIRQVKKALPATIDIVWSFDIGNTYSFRFFDPVAIKIFHPVDEPLDFQAVEAARGADMIFSVTQEILLKYQKFRRPMLLINHGVREDFIRYFSGDSYKVNYPVQVGYSGNMLRKDIDWTTIFEIVLGNPAVIFNFYGSFKMEHTDIGGSEEYAQQFIEQLKQCHNVYFHGILSSDKLIAEYAKMDAFLICYDILKDQSKGTNYHKIMEYLSTGRVIISNNVTSYDSRPDLIQMSTGRVNNAGLPEIFANVIQNLATFNSYTLTTARKSFAAENTYPKQIERIELSIQE